MSAPDLSPDSPISFAEAAAVLLRGLVKAATLAEAARTKKRRPPTPTDGLLALPAHLARWRRLDGPMTLYVASFHGRRQDRMQRAWRSACRLAGLGPDVTPHVLRHTSTTWEAIAGFDPWLICGRKAITMETFDQVYAHHHPDHLRARKSTGSRTELRRAGG